ncbi:hypothetical protein FG386_000766 [Cryptosporidium ryanae]|uniref:uncharacterized protein n=1 Tax=Cryptosporidium ryanae TaxID=515981 RepID=UPI00351A3E05|nr:hypothetical protein FG386_000766 [Cryptosporidium ryanae]
MLSTRIENEVNKNIELKSGELSNELKIYNVHKSTLKILSDIDKVEISGVSDCIILIGPVSTSIIISKCKNSLICVTCRQIRLHESEKLQILLSCCTPPLMENCREITFDLREKTNSNYYREYEHHLRKKNMNNHVFLSSERFTVSDFSWLRLQSSPNWNLGKIDLSAIK